MTTPAGTYATRFNARAIRRPRPTVAQMTDEQFARHLASLPSEASRGFATLARNLGRTFPSR